jgi:antibiotic biosynthesis monooxygenase (ABM) superfamily enzyme
MRDIHGLEGFFVPPAAGRPPAWKMALVTWLAVNPAVYVGSWLVPEVFGSLPPLARLLVTNAFVVASLTWILMPLLTRLFAGWLREAPAPEGTATP